MIRKIATIGKSKAVVIPKPFADYHELKPGEKITVVYGNVLLIIPEHVRNILKTRMHLIDELMGYTE